MKKIKIAEAKKILHKALVEGGLAKRQAEIVAEDYLMGELTSHTSHGLMAFPSLIDKKKISKAGKIKIKKEGDAFAYIDGGKSLGQLVGDEARKLLVKKAKRYGIAMVGCYNSRSYLRPGFQAEKIAEKDLIGIVVNNGGKARITPTGSTEAIFGTNPIGIGIPTKTDPIVADFASAKRAMGEVRLAKLLKQKLPKGIYRNFKGDFTLNPEDVETVVPFGGYKGYIIALLIEILSGSLVNMPMGKKDGDFRGLFFIAINPKKFTDYNKFLNANTKLVRQIKSLKREKGVKEIMLPGDSSRKNKIKTIKRGYFEVSDELHEKLLNL